MRDWLFQCHAVMPLDRLVRLILDVDRQCLAAEIAQGREGRLRAEVTAWNDFRQWLAAGGDGDTVAGALVEADSADGASPAGESTQV